MKDCSELQQIDWASRFGEKNLRFDDVETKNHPKNVEKVLVINHIVYLNLKKRACVHLMVGTCKNE